MMFALIRKECLMLFKSIIYYIYILLIALMFFSQMGKEAVTKPIPDMGEGAYGYKKVIDEEHIMIDMTRTLTIEFTENSYGTYPFGFYKSVKLNESDLLVVENVLKTLLKYNEANDFNQELKSMVYDNVLVMKEEIDFLEFKSYMLEIDDILGGKSSYSKDKFIGGSYIKNTYEDALLEYDSIVNDDQVTNALARLFADYLGIVLAILPAFVVIWRLILDKKNKVKDVVDSKGISSFTLVFSRFSGLVTMLLLPVIVISFFPLTQGIYSANIAGVKPDIFAFFEVIFGWLLPTLLFITALSYLLMEVFNSYISILIQIGVWFIALNSSVSNLVGSVSMHLIPRFNTLGSYDVFQSVYHDLILNRVVYVFLSVIILIMAIWIHSLRRKGKVTFGE